MFDFSEKDSCGVGFIASRNIPPTHGMTLKVLECLANLDHRGAKFADGTGDGAGVLTEIPFELIRAELAELNIEHDTNKKIGIISCFFDPKNIDESIELINNELKEYSIKHLYWRKVPTDKQILGTLARESKPKKCLFFSKNSEIATCFWFDASFSAIPDMRPFLHHGPPSSG